MSHAPKYNKTIMGWQDYLQDLYASRNSFMASDNLFAALVEKTAHLARLFTKSRRLGRAPNITENHFVQPLSWLFAIANRFKIDVGHAFVSKIPNACPYCLERPCLCLETNQRPKSNPEMPLWRVEQELRALARIYIQAHPSPTFTDIFEIMRSVYVVNIANWRLSPEIHFSRILEELGELREVIRGFEKDEPNTKKSAVEDEIADVFAWLCGAWLMIYPRLPDLSEAFALYYKDDCPVCRQFRCDCAKWSDRQYSMANLEDLKNLKLKFIELESELADIGQKNEISNAARSLSIAEESQKSIMVKGAVREVNQIVDKIGKTLSGADLNHARIKGLIGDISKILQDSTYFKELID